MSETVKAAMGILGAFLMAIGGAILFYFMYNLTINNFENVLPSADLLVTFLGFISFLFLGLGLLFIVQSGRS